MTAYPLEPSSSEMRAMAAAATEALVAFVDGLSDARASDFVRAEEIATRFRADAPESGEPFENVLASLVEGSRKGIETGGPGFFGFIPGGGLFGSALASYVALAMNRFVNLSLAAPALAQIEATVLRWMADLFGYPSGARGVFTSGGSLSNFSAIVTARHALLGEDFLAGTLYTSEQSHYSVAKAAMLAGFPRRNVRVVPCTPDLRIDIDALMGLIDADARAGMRPFCIVGNAGTTNTGAIDPLDVLAIVAGGRGMWFHIDGAYGGLFQMTERGRRALSGIGEANSITLDPHKAMFLPYGTGSLLVRDGVHLRSAHQMTGEYLQDAESEEEIPSFMDYGPELSRDFRGLRVWLPVKLHGLHAFRDALDEKLDLARFVYEELAATPGFKVPWEPELTVVPFRYAFSSGDPDTRNRELLERINASRRVFLSSTVVEGRFTLRVCVLSHRSHRDRVEECVAIIKRSAQELDR